MRWKNWFVNLKKPLLNNLFNNSYWRISPNSYKIAVKPINRFLLIALLQKLGLQHIDILKSWKVFFSFHKFNRFLMTLLSDVWKTPSFSAISVIAVKSSLLKTLPCSLPPIKLVVSWSSHKIPVYFKGKIKNAIFEG